MYLIDPSPSSLCWLISHRPAYSPGISPPDLLLLGGHGVHLSDQFPISTLVTYRLQCSEIDREARRCRESIELFGPGKARFGRATRGCNTEARVPVAVAVGVVLLACLVVANPAVTRRCLLSPISFFHLLFNALRLPALNLPSPL